MPHDITDNRTRELAPEISNFLADSVRAHFAVGYFFLSGFQAIVGSSNLSLGSVTHKGVQGATRRVL
jgi:hypothetical protein